jgi:endonuclease/exonuclease/phosphatase (EEP) superfamily protein YafD
MRARLARIIVILLQAAGALAALAAVAAQGGRFSAALDVLAQFAPLYGCIGLGVVGGAAFVNRKKRLAPAIAGLVAIAASATLVIPEFTRDAGPTAPAAAPGKIRIVQFNALRLNDQIGPIVDWLVAQRPDIVTIQEARHDLRDAILERTGWQVAGAAGDLMIFSARPRITMNRPDLAGGALHWVNATYPSASGPYEVVTVHLDWPLGPAQRRQWTSLATLVSRLPRERMIVTGDFNATPWGFTMREGERAMPLTRRDRALPTFPARWKADGPIRSPVPLLPIDHVYAGPGWRTVSIERGPALGSDHYPVVITLAPR